MALGPEDEEQDSGGQTKTKAKPKAPMSTGPKITSSKGASGARRRRTRCRRCDACQKTECGQCHFCKDMKKFGGPGRMKQSCLLRQCTAPVLPHTAVCLLCWEAGKEDTVDSEADRFNVSLMECTICNEIVHPGCLKRYDVEGVINNEIPNCWECPKCRHEGRSGKDGKDQMEVGGKRRSEGEEGPRWKLEEGGRPRLEDFPPNHRKGKKEGDGPIEMGPRKKKQKVSRVQEETTPLGHKTPQREKLERFKRMCELLERVRPARSSSSSSSSGSDSPDSEEGEEEGSSDGGQAGGTSAAALGYSASEEEEDEEEDEVEEEEDEGPPNGRPRGREPCPALRRERARRAADRQRFLRRPPVTSPPRPLQMERHVVRPPPTSPEPDSLPLDTGAHHVLHREAWMAVFQYLGHRDLCVCMRVCRTLNRWCCDKRLWTRMDLSHQKTITPAMLSGVVRRQPVALDLGWTSISNKQLMWLINRLQGLRELILSGCSWSSVSALCTASCSFLRLLDLCWVVDVKDSHLRELLSPPADPRTGQKEGRGRLQHATELRLAGLDVMDTSLRLLVRNLPRLRCLDLSNCPHVGDQSIHLLTAPTSQLRESLAEVNLAGCPRLTDQCLPLFHRCPKLSRIDLRSCELISAEACQRFVEESPPNTSFRCVEDKLLLRDS